jgi:Tol biopolymer transport system component
MNKKLMIITPLIIIGILTLYFLNTFRSPEAMQQKKNSSDSEDYEESSGNNPQYNDATVDLQKNGSGIKQKATKVKDKISETLNIKKDTLPSPPAKKSPFKLSEGKAITDKSDYIASTWSPDGLDVLLTKAKYSGLYLVSPDGSDMRKISDGQGIGYKAKWSEDGTKILYKEDGEYKAVDLSGEEVDFEENEFGLNSLVSSVDDNIFYSNPETGQEERLTNGEDAFFDPQLSPEGDLVAYQGLSSGLHIKDLQTGEIIDLGQGNGVQWTPSGEGVIYSYTQDDGHEVIAGDLYYASADGSGIYNITDTPDIIELNPTISPDGKQVTYEVDGQVFTADLIEADN